MVPMLSANPVVIYPKEGVFLQHGREVMPAPNFVTLVCHMSPYRPHKLRKDLWVKLEAERPVFERLAAAAVKREVEVVSCMVQAGTVGAVTHPSGKRVSCGLPAKAGVEATPIFSGGSMCEVEVVSCMMQEDTVGVVTHPSGKRVRCGFPAKVSGGGSKREDEAVSCMVQEDTVSAVTHPSSERARCVLPAEEAGVETTPISAVDAFSTQSWQDPSGVLEQSVRKAET
ncbi:hypothetical protein SARC_05020 [Sphaeroforma arctica JP610]|uniref:Uncharacterized protein n=1 Tax=Sphaeroforma arctica JP610 TaxID=667725 RepID=A0A0L0G0R6_9EUKA|nr:hypothetical protein SARC_05020 [Sphaeroforma arctica JP610]KNC82702.1 hypothetical protein SARC_05020 [Sphaeroforma arctica JP610]|eukprot:XP_014156604.1 hypothetical protein SARC_05020 [Sphaeroforma arctica JP610]